jgi:hypothetical protein
MKETITEGKILTWSDLASFKDEEERRKCEEKYIAIKGLKDKELLRDEIGEPIAGKNLVETYEKARRMGYEDPLIFFYPKVRRRYAVLIVPISMN